MSGYRKGQRLVETVLLELCVQMGFCLPPDGHARMLDMPTGDLDVFVDAIFAAQGLEEPYDRDLWRGVRDQVGRRLGDSH